LVNEIWEDKGYELDGTLTKKEAQAFVTEYVQQLDKNFKISQDAFEQMYK